MNYDAQQEIHYRLLKLLAEEPQMRQKDMAKRMGISVGVVNYCIRELAKQGLIKIKSYKSEMNKFPQHYILTPRGIEEKGRITVRFLKRKIEEYEEIKRQIQLLTREIEQDGLQDLVSAEPKEAATTTA
jgi:EPS-associated MarR family transcriptional regulator